MILVICGPTGVGKTKMSIELAKKYNATIVNADACQVYKNLDIGTGKIKETEKEGISHLLMDIKEVNEEYTVFDYQKDLRTILSNYKEQNVIIVGGTNLYICAALYDYQFKEKVNEDFDCLTNQELYNKVKQLDPNTKIHVNNRIRLENFLKTKNVVTEPPKLLYDAKFIGLTTDRNTLYKKIDNRVDEMMNEGLVEEVKNLYYQYPESRILKSAIGYKEIIRYLDNDITLEAAIDLIKKNSRHYAKRQYTWMNNKMNINWFNVDYDNFENTIYEVMNFIEDVN